MQDRLYLAFVGIQYIAAHTGPQPNPAVLQVTMDSGSPTVLPVFSLTVTAARQLKEALEAKLQEIDSR